MHDMPTATAPESPERPWIAFVDKEPPEDSLVEVYCVDGKTRHAKTMEKKDGRLMFEIFYEAGILEKQQADPMRYCPTHWRPNDVF